MAETEGFEPSVPFWGYAHLANECLQPLGHVSTPPASRDASLIQAPCVSQCGGAGKYV